MNYSQRIARALQSLRLPPGTISTASVKHDLACPGARGCPVCRCQPIITIKTPTGTVAVLADGSIRQPSTNN
jgi:hypothetical protein